MPSAFNSPVLKRAPVRRPHSREDFGGGDLKMRLGGERESSNVEDGRGGGGGRIAIGGGIGGLAILLIATLLGLDPRQLLNPAPDAGPAPGAQTQQAPGTQHDDQMEFVRRVLGSTETTWEDIFKRNGASYREPKLRLF